MKCVVTNLKTNQPSLISMFTTDFLLLILMLAGLFRLRRRGGGTFELGRLLWRQVRAVVLVGYDVVDQLMRFIFQRVSSGSLLLPSQNLFKW